MANPTRSGHDAPEGRGMPTTTKSVMIMLVLVAVLGALSVMWMMNATDRISDTSTPDVDVRAIVTHVLHGGDTAPPAQPQTSMGTTDGSSYPEEKADDDRRDDDDDDDDSGDGVASRSTDASASSVDRDGGAGSDAELDTTGADEDQGKTQSSTTEPLHSRDSGDSSQGPSGHSSGAASAHVGAEATKVDGAEGEGSEEQSGEASHVSAEAGSGTSVETNSMEQSQRARSEERASGSGSAEGGTEQKPSPEFSRTQDESPYEAHSFVTLPDTYIASSEAVNDPKLGLHQFNMSCRAWAHFTSGKWQPWLPPPRNLSQTYPPNHNHLKHVTSGVIVYLARTKNLQQLVLSLQYLDKFYNDVHHTPVAIFHQDLSKESQEVLRSITNSALSFHLINMCIPSHLQRHRVKKHVASASIGYRHMLRFFALMLASHPAMARYEFFMRMDTDSLLLTPLQKSPFSTLARKGGSYGFLMLWKDSPSLVKHLDTVSLQFLKRHHIPGTDLPFLRQLMTHEGAYNGVQFWNNFEVVRLDFLRSPLYVDFVQRIELQGLMYYDRVGDAPIRTLAVAMLLDSNQVHLFGDVGYQHQDQFCCPTDKPAGEGFLTDETNCPVNVDLDFINKVKCHAIVRATEQEPAHCRIRRRQPCRYKHGGVPFAACDFAVSNFGDGWDSDTMRALFRLNEFREGRA